ncbi:MAG: single-stranded-DNA-specific exonuclease RecJ, partial [Candidatus Gracilibacteria bacterium]|nr:single-stranded-DNA-specific exonuclease RecJ [Candidatus Gracilibacteria bacterium]
MEIKSIKGNIIKFDLETKNKNIKDILSKRFENTHKENDISDLHDPYLLADMQKAVDRVKQAVKLNQRIVIFGDYDVDGVTSTSILVHFFKKIGAQISYRLPHRVKDGYGMKSYFIDELKPLDVKLIITVDCGTRDIDVIKYAKQNGIDIIVTDHHAVPDIIPEEAIAIINPKRKDCNYPFKHLAGAGVALKFMMALSKEYFNEVEYLKYLNESLDIAAIGTVADCMPLIGENRTIVTLGLKNIKESRSVGIRKLISDKIEEDLDADIFGFLIGPRINAAGRLDTPYKALNLILNNGDKIDEIIDEIENINNTRKDLTKIFTEDAMGKINIKNNILFYDSKEIEHGIIGIVAGRLTENFHKPSIVLKDEGEKLVASCRSPEYFSIINILEKYKKYFLHFGGHK